MTFVEDNLPGYELDLNLDPDPEQYLVFGTGRLAEIHSDVHLRKTARSEGQAKCLIEAQHANNVEATNVNYSTAMASWLRAAQATEPSLNRQASYAIAMIGSREASIWPSLEDSCATGTLIGESCTVNSMSTMPQSCPQLQPRGPPATALNIVSSMSPSTIQIVKQTKAGLAPALAIDAISTPITSQAGARGGPAKSARPVTRGARGHLAYDTQQLDARTARRMLGNRASAKLSQRRRLERVQKAEAALERCAAENAALRVRLAAALGFIEQLGHPAPPITLPTTYRLGLCEPIERSKRT